VKLRTILGLGVGYAIGSQFGPDQIQRMLAALVDQSSEATSAGSPSSDHESDDVADVSWPSTEFQP
jgi:hypothetical protein